MRLLERFGAPLGATAKIIDGQHSGMFHSGGTSPKPDMLPVAGSEEGQAGGHRPNVVVAVTGTNLDTEVVTLGCNLAKVKKSNVYLVYGIEVPRKLPIDAEMPEATAAASEALERATRVAEQMHVKVEPEIVQSRHVGQSLVDEAKAHECALLIVGLPYQVGMGGHFDLGEVADYALKNAPCRVWLVRGRPEEVAQKADWPESVGAAR